MNDLLEFLVLHKQSLNRQIEALNEYIESKNTVVPNWESSVDTQMWEEEVTLVSDNL